MKTGNKTYFDLDIVKNRLSTLGVLYQDIQQLPCIDDFNTWFYGSTCGVYDDGSMLIYLHDWEYFANNYVKNGELKTYLQVENQVLERFLFSNVLTKS